MARISKQNVQDEKAAAGLVAPVAPADGIALGKGHGMAQLQVRLAATCLQSEQAWALRSAARDQQQQEHPPQHNTHSAYGSLPQAPVLQYFVRSDTGNAPVPAAASSTSPLPSIPSRLKAPDASLTVQQEHEALPDVSDQSMPASAAQQLLRDMQRRLQEAQACLQVGPIHTLQLQLAAFIGHTGMIACL